MKIKTSELTNGALDYAVAMAELGCEGCLDRGLLVHRIGYGQPAPNYSTDWALSGPIIRRERISIMAPIVRRIGKEKHALPVDYWRAMICTDENEPATHGRGTTELVAAMICFVTSKLGDEVDIPEGLL